jgi:signal peptidase I
LNADTKKPVDSDEIEDTEPRTFWEWLFEQVRTWFPAILAVIVIRMFIFEPFSIPSQSMVPTLLIGDHVLVTKYSYGLWVHVPFTLTSFEVVDWADPHRGDVIVFKYPRPPHQNYIKRVVGVPGDVIEVRNNRIVLNGKEQTITRDGEYTYKDGKCLVATANAYVEELTVEGGEPAVHTALMDQHRFSVLANRGPFTVGEHEVFVMGDNRDRSGDSREWGMVDYGLIKGKAHFVWLSHNKCEGSLSFRGERFMQWLYE